MEDVLCPTGGYAHFTISNATGSGLPNEASYAVSEALVEDTVTGLSWQRFASSRPMGFAEASKHCEALVAGDRDDFRLPGRIELVTLLDFEELPVAPSVFEDVVADYHWSSSPASFVEGSAYTVYFGAGEVTIASADPGLALARCVAGPVPREPTVRFATQGTLVTDTVTGLVWEAVAGARANWADAAVRCEEIGMRLPSLRELESIVDERRHAPALDLAVFGGEHFELTWTSSSRGSSPWAVDFTDGKTYANLSLRDELESRCVSR
jgi:hypothetical protein